MANTATIPRKMTADEFLAWAIENDERRVELHDGDVVRMPPERAAHAEVKIAMAFVLRDAIRAAKVPCRVFGDGFAVRIDDRTIYEPDALVRCGERLGPDTISMSDPVIVAEVLSPSSMTIDLHDKLAGYFRLPPIHHYLTVNPRSRVILHHARDGADIRTRILQGGSLRLDPPGLTLDLDALFD